MWAGTAASGALGADAAAWVESRAGLVCGVKLMSPGGREVAPSGGEREDAGPGLLTHCRRLPQRLSLQHETQAGQTTIILMTMTRTVI